LLSKTALAAIVFIASGAIVLGVYVTRPNFGVIASSKGPLERIMEFDMTRSIAPEHYQQCSVPSDLFDAIAGDEAPPQAAMPATPARICLVSRTLLFVHTGPRSMAVVLKSAPNTEILRVSFSGSESEPVLDLNVKWMINDDTTRNAIADDMTRFANSLAHSGGQTFAQRQASEADRNMSRFLKELFR